MSFSVRCDHTGLEYSGTSLNTLFAQRKNIFKLPMWRMLIDILRFNYQASRIKKEMLSCVTVEEYLRANSYGRYFQKYYLKPLGSALWSCPHESFKQFPIVFVIDFLKNHEMLKISGRSPWRVIRGGSRQYVNAICEPFEDRIRLSTPVSSIKRVDAGIQVSTESGDMEKFDEVILACHADQALNMLQEGSKEEKDILSCFPYQENDVVLHTDSSMLPQTKRAWASWNYHIRPDITKRSTMTYDMNILQRLDPEDEFCVTLNESDAIRPEKVLARLVYEHPVYTLEGRLMQKRREEMIRRRGISYCGAYWGFGFHEDGVRSALQVCRAFGKELD
jgi:predicted NAD/FAD-binding protein